MKNAGDTVSESPLQVLLVEDDRGDALLVREILTETHSAEVEWVERIGTAIEHLEQHSFDLVLLDLGLPDAQGFDGLARVLQIQPPVPVVVLTGLDDDSSALTALEHGAQDYLVKGSIERDLLRRTIRYSVERHRVQQALVEREELYQALVDTIPEIVYSRDLDGYVTFIGAKADEICGVGRERLYRREKTWYDYLHPEDAEQVILDVSEAVRLRQEFKLEYRSIDAHGRLRWFVDHGRGVFTANGALERVDGILFDITERKRREELRETELRESREALEQLQNTAAHLPGEPFQEMVEAEENLAALEAEYQSTLEDYVAARRANQTPDRRAARRLAEFLTRQSATPNDLVQMHLQAVQGLVGEDDERMSAISRLMLLELMGYLANQYRQLALRARAATPPGAPPRTPVSPET